MTKKELSEKYISENPDMFKRELARKMHYERPDMFKTIEEARGSVRYAVHGSRRDAAVPGFETQSELMKLYAIRNDKKTTQDYHITATKVGIMGDLHIPFHAEDAIAATLDYFKQKEVDAILINGDLVDFYQLSRWSKDPAERPFSHEVRMTVEFLTYLRDAFPDANIYWKMGNHEDRYENFLRTNAKELIGLEDFEMSSIFDLDYLNIKLVGSRQKMKIGKLNVVHGHEFGQSIFSPVNPARGLFLRAKASCITNHHHQSSHHAENDINGNPTGCWSIGCLCDLRPDYRPFAFTKWNHGAAVVAVSENGNFHVDSINIIDGKVV